MKAAELSRGQWYAAHSGKEIVPVLLVDATPGWRKIKVDGATQVIPDGGRGVLAVEPITEEAIPNVHADLAPYEALAATRKEHGYAPVILLPGKIAGPWSEYTARRDADAARLQTEAREQKALLRGNQGALSHLTESLKGLGIEVPPQFAPITRKGQITISMVDLDSLILAAHSSGGSVKKAA